MNIQSIPIIFVVSEPPICSPQKRIRSWQHSKLLSHFALRVRFTFWARFVSKPQYRAELTDSEPWARQIDLYQVLWWYMMCFYQFWALQTDYGASHYPKVRILDWALNRLILLRVAATDPDVTVGPAAARSYVCMNAIPYPFCYTHRWKSGKQGK